VLRTRQGILSKRRLLQAPTIASVLVVGGLLTACGSSDESDTTTSAGAQAQEEGFQGGQKPPVGKEPGSGDHVESAHATFTGFKPGFEVRIIGGGGGTSNCTTNETVTSFKTTGQDSQQYQFVARSGGGCYIELSWSNFKVELRDPNDGNRVVATGIMWLGQPDFVAGYRASCYSGPPSRIDQGPDKQQYRWDRMKCEQTGRYDVKVTQIAQQGAGDDGGQGQ
jgi:hypothetical protein